MAAAPQNFARYDSVAVTLHWLIAALIILMLAVGLVMEGLPVSIKFVVYNLHKSTGITIIGLSIFRLVWRLLNPPPTLPADMSRSQKFLAHTAHWMLYGFMITMPISGWLMVSALPQYPIVFFGLGEAPFLPMPQLADPKAASAFLKSIHETLADGALVLLAMHIGAALQHHFIKRDTILLRMLPKFLHKYVQMKPRV